MSDGSRDEQINAADGDLQDADAFGIFLDSRNCRWGDRDEIEPGGTVETVGSATTNQLLRIVLREQISNDLELVFCRVGLVVLCSESWRQSDRRLGAMSEENFNSLVAERAKCARLLGAISAIVNANVVNGTGSWSDPILVTGENLTTVRFGENDRVDSVSGASARDVLSRTRRTVMVPYSVPTDALRTCADSFRAAVRHKANEQLIEMLALLNEATVAYKAHNFASATVLAWTVCERSQSEQWREYCNRLDANGDFVANRKRREHATKAEFTAGIRTTVLSLAGIYDRDFAANLDTARQRRNAWLHGGLQPSSEDATRCIEVAAESIGEVYGYSIRPHPTYPIHF